MGNITAINGSIGFLRVSFRIILTFLALTLSSVYADTTYRKSTTDAELNQGTCYGDSCNLESSANKKSNSVLHFIPPLPTVPSSMVAGTAQDITYNIVNNAPGVIDTIETNYDGATTEITRLDQCTSLAAGKQCQIKLRVSPSSSGTLPRTLTLQLKIDAQEETIKLDDVAHSIKIVGGAPTITTPPQSQTIATGKPVVLSVTASGPTPLHYQWYKDGTKIGTDSATLNIDKAQTNNSGIYTVTVSNQFGYTPSAAAILKVGDAPTITGDDPKDQTIITSKSVGFSVVASGTAPLSYQWYKNDQAISTATGQTYSIGSATSSNNGVYKVKVSNKYNPAGVFSREAILKVGDAPTITTPPQSQTIATSKPVDFSVVASGTAPLHYQWYKDGTEIGIDIPTFSIRSVKPDDN